jgi:SAM-dependent methyltransferase
VNDDVRGAIERGWRELAEIHAALERGEIDEAGWHDAVAAIIEPAYLGAETPQGQSGYTGDAAEWEQARRLLLDGVDRDGTFLDVGCANGFLMESVQEWARRDGHAIEPYGVDISAPLAELARSRCPQWAERIWTANALGWRPPRRFDYVRAGLEYVPERQRRDLVRHLLEHAVAPRGRLLLGVVSEEKGTDRQTRTLLDWGFQVAGSGIRPHQHQALVRRVSWIDAPGRTGRK